MDMYYTYRKPTYVFTLSRNDSLSQTELTAKLEPAFLCGLRCSDVQLRGRFFEVYNHSVQKRLFDRLLYIMCSQVHECMTLIIHEMLRKKGKATQHNRKAKQHKSPKAFFKEKLAASSGT